MTARDGSLRRKLLENVPRIGFPPHVDHIELTPLPSCLRACLEYLGEPQDYPDIMVTTGAGFRLLWKPGWHGDNIDILNMSDDPLEPVRRGFEAVGRGFSAYVPDAADEGWCSVYPAARPLGHSSLAATVSAAEIRDRIVSSIEVGMPVLAFGVVGPPECSIITGYDDGGATLLGWSFFQECDMDEPAPPKEPTGQFRKAGWEASTAGIVTIGERVEAPERQELDLELLRRAVEIARTPMVRGRHAGVAAYDAWADALLSDPGFDQPTPEWLDAAMMAHDDNVTVVAEGRWYAAVGLSRLSTHHAFRMEHILMAAACYAKEHALMWQVWGALDGQGRSPEHCQRLAEPERRQRIAALIREAGAKDAEAADHLERAID